MRDKTFNIANISRYDGYQRGLASMAYNVFDKNTSATRANKFAGSGIKREYISDKELAGGLHKSIARKFKKRKVHPSFSDNI